MTAVHATVGVAVLLTCGVTGAWGAWCWARGLASPRFWPLLRVTQGVLLLQVLLGALLLLLGHKPRGNLHILYGVLPVLVMFFAEQLRIGAADQVLDAHGLESAQAVGELPEDEQRAVVMAIVRRETGVMAAAALVALALALRAVSTAGGF
jgi:hypothetical protein